MAKFRIGQEVEVLQQVEPERWTRAFIRSVGPEFCGVTLRIALYETHAILAHIRPLDMSLGDLGDLFEIVDGCNGLYVYFTWDNSCVAAGDGTETTMADLVGFARCDPVGFIEAYGPGQTWDDASYEKLVGGGYTAEAMRARLDEMPRWEN